MSIVLSAVLVLVSFFGFLPTLKEKINFGKSPVAKLVFTAQLKEAAPRLVIPKKNTDVPLPSLTAQAFFVLDPTSQTILAEQNSETEWPIASLTKLMSA